jgi:hypothetical protein
MLKKIMLLMTAVAAMFAIGAQAASAEWYDKGTALVGGENPTLEITGTVAFTSTGGGVHCNTGTATLQATGGTTDGHVLAFGVEETSKCEVSGGLVFLTGGTTTLKSVTLTGTPTGVNNGGNTIDVSNVTLHNEFNNGFKLTLSSIAGQPLVSTPNNTTSVSSATLSGELNSTLSAGKVKVAGSLNVLAPNVGTYGLVS